PVLVNLTGQTAEAAAENLGSATAPLSFIIAESLTFILCLLALALLRRSLLAGRAVTPDATWGCGYAGPTPRVQYTASSFAQPLTHLFRWVLGTKAEIVPPSGYFPDRAELKTETPDLCHGNLYQPGFLKMKWAIARLQFMQRGHVQLYVLYIAVTLIVLLAWKFR
ncbi:MAG TPA: hypothetical protein VMH30_09510, partial [Verrucomicrobiae bacterium]|nr:hypothetical protein [Verrucomicrobiae bacterium]